MSHRGSPSDSTDQDTNTTDGGTPAGVTVDGGGAPPVSGDANLSADASSASGDPGAKEPPKPTLADVIKTGLELNEEGKSPAPAKDGSAPEGGDPAAAKAGDDAKPQDDKDLPFHNHPRWKEVTGQNKELTAKVATLEPKAQELDKITEFMTANNLSHNEVGEGFVIMAMAKAGDPRVLQRLDDFRNKVALAIGEAVPEDIQAKIDSGEITEAAGKELAKARANTSRLEADNTRRQQQDQQRTERDAAERLANECQTAVTNWETETRKTDPDFAKKESAIERYARALMQQKGAPKNSDEAVALMKAAYTEVNKDFGSFAPQKQPVSRIPTAPSSNGASEKPKSLIDAVSKAVNS